VNVAAPASAAGQAYLLPAEMLLLFGDEFTLKHVSVWPPVP